jgi:hypothetical protein
MFKKFGKNNFKGLKSAVKVVMTILFTVTILSALTVHTSLLATITLTDMIQSIVQEFVDGYYIY